ncbi:SDR family oxidoreductase [Deinococcus sp. Marseille-Q6407]|uniref:SDR family oxidoreductase n=1 Tax=Deinococcus sp. Marseille-Q6407 TaxID=2969223 RepID=UPI0021C00047|nr:NAD(P)-dependent oxidoreductase [Deinococcus sp. Marseille-Q6407]
MRLLVTGGSGRLGRALRTFFPQAWWPSHAELDVTRSQQVQAAVAAYRPDLILHAAAYTDVARAETDRATCWQVNVEGTRHIARATLDHGARLVFVSTDYVFQGDRGQYREDDPPGVPTTYYGLTKLVAEEAARQAGALLLRTSFRERPFPHPQAVTDAYTSQDYLDVLLPELALAVQHALELGAGPLHVSSVRRSVYELARLSRPDVRPVRRADMATPLPQDVSLDSSRWRALSQQWRIP